LEPSRRSGILSFATEDPSSLKKHLDSRGIVVSEREHAIRVSPHLYNTSGEMETLCRALRDYLG
ncbi:MAG: aminotransferase class V-fold PLP-dependent enzyme, partial [Candidatus Eisenbacteria bacterium]